MCSRYQIWEYMCRAWHTSNQCILSWLSPLVLYRYLQGHVHPEAAGTVLAKAPVIRWACLCPEWGMGY